jgi:hypothetical protein
MLGYDPQEVISMVAYMLASGKTIYVFSGKTPKQTCCCTFSVRKGGATPAPSFALLFSLLLK